MARLVLLGGLRLEDDHGPLTGRASQKRRLALLALLAVPPGHLVTRDKLVGYLWPERDDERARRLLSAALYDLRRELGEEALQTPGDEIGLDPAVVTSDAAAFLAALDAGDPETAVRLYGGPFLDGAYLGASAEFERWVDAERQRYAWKYREALERLAARREREGDTRGAADVWRRLANEDPCNKRVALGYMRALVAAGERARAIQFAGVHAALLREEYDAEPDPEVTALAGRLRQEPTEPPRPEQPGDGHERPVGRDSAPEPDQPAGTGDGGQAAEERQSAGPEADRTPAPDPAVAAVAHAGGTPGRAIGRMLGPVAAGAALVVLAFVMAESWSRDPVDTAPAGPIRLAVLPLENLSDSATAAFTDGLSEEILLALDRVDGLIVTDPTSAFLYRNRDPRPRISEIARELQADYLLLGTVRKGAERLRASVRLVNASDEVVWSDSYDSRESGALGVQEQIARDVVRQLEPELGRAAWPGHDQGPLVSYGRTDPIARDHYRTARGYWLQRNLLAALSEYQQAVARDSGYARAWAGLADVYNTMGAYDVGMLTPDSAYRTARAAAERALRLAPGLPEARAALGLTLFNYDWDWEGAKQELTAALELNPGDSMTRHWLSLLLRVTGDTAQAIRQIGEAHDRDPRSAVIATSLCRHHYFAGEVDRALRECRRATHLDPSYVQAHLALGLVAVQKGQPDLAIEEYELAQRLSEAQLPVVLALMAHAHGRAGDTARAHQYYDRLVAAAIGPGTYVPPQFPAVAAIGAGLHDDAVRWLEAALDERSAAWIYIGVEPLVDPLRSHAPFRRLVERARREGLDPVLPAGAVSPGA